MAITLTSTSNDTKAIADVFAAKGLTPVAPVEDAVKVSNVEDKKPTGETPVEGQEHSESVPAGDKPKADTEDKQQGKEVKPKVEGEEEKPKAKGGFQAKIDKLTASRDRLQEDLDAERGGKAKLQAQIDELNAQLGTLKPTQTKEELKTDGPVRPTRPTREQFEYDEEKYEVAMAKYETDSDAYHDAVAEKKVADLRASLKKEGEDKQAADVKKAQMEEYSKRFEAGLKDIGDLDELLAEVPDGHQGLFDKSFTAENYILRKAKNPAALLRYMANDYVNNDDAESKRLLALDDYDLVIELRAIEDTLNSAKKVTPVVDTDPGKTKTEDAPVKPQPKPKQVVPDSPIEPVGGRHQPSLLNLDEQLEAAAKAQDIPKFRELRRQQRAAKLPAKVA